jgi:Lon protease-like protein
MTNFIPIFPLGIVVYPGEELNLHIFEPRYKQLIADCRQSKKPFGIPSVIDDHINELGTLVELVEITKLYDNGEMDIKTKGTKVFRVLEILKDVPEKLYSGAIVNYPENHKRGSAKIMKVVVEGIKQLHSTLQLNKKFKKPDNELSSYDVAHHAGLSVEEEYELLGLFYETQREEYLKRHLAKVLPVAAEMELLKNKVQLNGHFKNLKGFDI